MSFEIQGSCAAQLNQPPCTGNSPEACPGGFTGMDTEDGNPGGCQSLNEGVSYLLPYAEHFARN